MLVLAFILHSSGTTAIVMHLKRNHPGQWASYEEKKNEKKQETATIKKEERESCEMENAEIRFFDIRTHGGRKPFLNKVLCLPNPTLISIALLPVLTTFVSPALSSRPHCPFTHTVLLCKCPLTHCPQVLPDVAEPEVYWSEDDPRAIKAHQGILAQIVLDFQPFNIVNSKGFLVDKRLTMPQLKVHTPPYYADRLEKVKMEEF